MKKDSTFELVVLFLFFLFLGLVIFLVLFLDFCSSSSARCCSSEDPFSYESSTVVNAGIPTWTYYPEDQCAGTETLENLPML